MQGEEQQEQSADETAEEQEQQADPLAELTDEQQAAVDERVKSERDRLDMKYKSAAEKARAEAKAEAEAELKEKLEREKLDEVERLKLERDEARNALQERDKREAAFEAEIARTNFLADNGYVKLPNGQERRLPEQYRERVEGDDEEALAESLEAQKEAYLAEFGEIAGSSDVGRRTGAGEPPTGPAEPEEMDGEQLREHLAQRGVRLPHL